MVKATTSAGLFCAVLMLTIGCAQGGDVGVAWADTGGWADAGGGPAEAPSGCDAGPDVRFEGRPDDVLPLLTGLRSATGTTSTGEVAVTLDLSLPPERSWWEWIERDGVCWSSLQIVPDVLALTVGEGSVTSGQQVTVITPNGSPMLILDLEASAALVGADPDDRVTINITRSESAERGIVSSENGEELVRW